MIILKLLQWITLAVEDTEVQIKLKIKKLFFKL